MGKTAVPQFGWVTPRFRSKNKLAKNTDEGTVSSDKLRRKDIKSSSRKNKHSKPPAGVGGDDFSWYDCLTVKVTGHMDLVPYKFGFIVLHHR